MAADVTGNWLSAIAYKIASLSVYIFNRSASRYYNSWANYKLALGSSHLVQYLTFGKDLINFGCNRPKGINKPLSLEENGVRGLKKIYGDHVIEEWMKIGTPEVPLVAEKLAYSEMDQGICFGMSLDFISKVLQQVREGKELGKAVKEVSCLYDKGGSEEAQLIQIFYSALDSSKMRESVYSQMREQLLASERQRLLNMGDEFLVKPGDTLEDAEAKVEKLQTKLNESLKDFTARVAQEKKQADIDIAILRDQFMGGPLKLKLDPPKVYKGSQLEEAVDPNFVDFLQNLPSGIYCGGLKSDQLGHAYVLIKRNGVSFFFDPNIGTLSLPTNEIAQTLHKICSSFYRKENYDLFEFFPCSLP